MEKLRQLDEAINEKLPHYDDIEQYKEEINKIVNEKILQINLENNDQL